MKNLSVYIHVPFCKSKCTYCAFTSFADCNDDHIKKYFDYLKQEILSYSTLLGNRQLKTIYIGGGTPSVVSSQYIEEILELLKSKSNCDSLEEVTIEINPGTISEKQLKHYYTLGINRLSFGLQSANDTILNFLGRIHTYEAFKNNITLARTIGFKNISADIIFGIPGQTLDHLKDTLEELISIDIDHISAYSLTIEENTKLFELLETNVIEETSAIVDRQQYKQIIRTLENNHYSQYEISNFSKLGYESKHNLIYWNHKDYLGLGLSAHGFINKERYGNYSSFKQYYNRLDHNKLPIRFKESLTDEELLFERIILNLRLKKGIDITKINKEYQIDFIKKYKNIIETLMDNELAILEKNRFSLTTQGLSLSNKIFVEFMD